MIAAIYARKSTEQNGVNEQEKSVARQIDHAKAYAAKKGWTVDERFIYCDDGISGAEFVKRHGFLRLMNALKPKPPFQVLIMSEESRLGREAIKTSYALQQIMDAGVRVFFYLEDCERKLDTAMDKVLLSLKNFASEMEREKASQRTYDTMMRKAKALHVTGGKTFGYDNVDVMSDELGPDGKARRQHVIRRINEDEAAIVQRVFEMAAGGYGLTRLAKTLNVERVPPPGWGRRGWAPSAIREILHRELYRGVVVWNKTQAIHRDGTKRSRKRPESEWVRIEASELRIISDELWERVHSRFKQSRRSYLRGPGGRLRGRPAGEDIASQYLLTGFVQCACCGGSITALTRAKGQYTRKVYGCAYYSRRGEAVCSNRIQVPREVLETALLTALEEVLDESILEAAVQRALAKLRQAQAEHPDRRTVLESKLVLVQTRLRHLADAVARGQGSETLFATLQAEEERKKVIEWDLMRLDRAGHVSQLDPKRVVDEIHERLGDVRGLLSRQVPQARQMLRKVIEGRLQCEPYVEDGKKGFRFSGTGTFARVLAESKELSVLSSSPALHHFRWLIRPSC